MSITNEVTILIVEDDWGHARLIEKNLKRSGITNPFIHLENGQQAIDYIYKDDIPVKPTLILLDLNMPVMDGYQVLEKLKSDEHTQSIPIIVLTTTDDPQEIDRCYELGCNVYLTKPVAYDAFTAAINNLGLFLSVVSIPANEGGNA